MSNLWIVSRFVDASRFLAGDGWCIAPGFSDRSDSLAGTGLVLCLPSFFITDAAQGKAIMKTKVRYQQSRVLLEQNLSEDTELKPGPSGDVWGL